jgi:hypothetical protein
MNQRLNEDDHQLANFVKVRTHKAYMILINRNIQNEASIAAITASDKPRVWRITVPASDEGQLEEVVLRVQGVLCLKELPPVVTKL